MPELSSFAPQGIPIVISFDGTGHGTQQLNTAVVRNPYLSCSNQQLRIFGLGNVADDREGTRRVFGPNLEIINDTIEGTCAELCVDTEEGIVKPRVLVSLDTAALRHVEHIAGSGWCGCSRDFALRTTPKNKPSTIEELHEFLKQCSSPTKVDRSSKIYWTQRKSWQAIRRKQAKPNIASGEWHMRTPTATSNPANTGSHSFTTTLTTRS
mmetsp:Transcript_7677/g.15985  ORF Transcript_7677/g.15985 Transcript_7677/m.15985 type:complete len:210 (-) Transcript_7677:1227-1856(-)